MLKIGHLKSGGIISINDEGIMREGTVVSISPEENQALVNNGGRNVCHPVGRRPATQTRFYQGG